MTPSAPWASSGTATPQTRTRKQIETEERRHRGHLIRIRRFQIVGVPVVFCPEAQLILFCTSLTSKLSRTLMVFSASPPLVAAVTPSGLDCNDFTSISSAFSVEVNTGYLLLNTANGTLLAKYFRQSKFYFIVKLTLYLLKT